MAAIPVPVFEVVLTDQEPFEVRVTQGLQIKWDQVRAERRWPQMDEAQSLWSGFVAYAAARRDGKIAADMPFEAFADVVESITLVTTDDADPTNPAPEHD